MGITYSDDERKLIAAFRADPEAEFAKNGPEIVVIFFKMYDDLLVRQLEASTTISAETRRRIDEFNDRANDDLSGIRFGGKHDKVSDIRDKWGRKS